jgi:hypothetical protein
MTKGTDGELFTGSAFDYFFASAYTDIAAIFHRFFGFVKREPARILAAERACPQRQPGLTRFLFLLSLAIFSNRHFPAGKGGVTDERYR